MYKKALFLSIPADPAIIEIKGLILHKIAL